MYKIISPLFVIFVLSGCSDATPIKITEKYKKYVGVWQLRIENIRDNSMKIDNMILAINYDGKAVYRKCEINKKESKNTKRSSRYSVNFPDAVLTLITDNTLTLVQEVGWFGFGNEIAIDRVPYQENGNWYIHIEGKKLTKLKGNNIQSQTDWECPDDEEEKI